MGEEALRHLICESDVDLMALPLEKKNVIRKMYKVWLRSNHPDKWNPNEERELSLDLCKMFSSVFLRYDDQSYERVWTFMGYSALTFNQIDVDTLLVRELRLFY